MADTDETEFNYDESVEKYGKVKATNWVLTVFDEDGSRRQRLETLPDWAKCLAYGDEVTKRGRKHYQCYVTAWNPVRFSQFQPWIGKSWRSPMLGRLADSEDYCSKQSRLKIIGQKENQGRRTDLIGTKRRLDQLKPGESLMDVAREEPHFQQIMRCERSMQKYVENKRFRDMKGDYTKPELTWIVGAAGCGKTSLVYFMEPDIYDVPDFKWFDGYCGQEAVLFNNVTDSHCPKYVDFLRQVDRYSIQVPVKGGFVAWHPKRIYVTSLGLPARCWPYIGDLSEVNRRIDRYLGSGVNMLVDYTHLDTYTPYLWMLLSRTVDYLSPVHWCD
ncbi:putative Rep protein [Circovirus-like genome DCCV-9]|uniref:putative Rep protein n=1 Tax=Circovirus-like genome DCCV-9 TaxID=1788449 RepID=UPI0007F9ED2E|nr:putative Rep protein [Circovirus-like genome DCCV-9]AMB42978.1 putative Rep protein [Circovirus-like genome DCCV-9]